VKLNAVAVTQTAANSANKSKHTRPTWRH